VTHPPGRKTCVHCGGRVLPSRDSGAPVHVPPEVFLPGTPGETPGGEAPEQPSARRVRLATTLIWIALAIGAAVLRICQEATNGR
jgi:hypothetical protein